MKREPGANAIHTRAWCPALKIGGSAQGPCLCTKSDAPVPKKLGRELEVEFV